MTEVQYPVDDLYLIRFKQTSTNHSVRTQIYLVNKRISKTGNININTKKTEKICQFVNFFTNVPVMSFYFYNPFEYYENKHKLKDYIQLISLFYN